MLSYMKNKKRSLRTADTNNSWTLEPQTLGSLPDNQQADTPTRLHKPEQDANDGVHLLCNVRSIYTSYSSECYFITIYYVSVLVYSCMWYFFFFFFLLFVSLLTFYCDFYTSSGFDIRRSIREYLSINLYWISSSNINNIIVFKEHF